MSANDKQVGGSHYQGGQYQHWDWCVANNLGYLEGQLTKYISRWRRKGLRQDLGKAEHYAAKLVECGTTRISQKPWRSRPVQVKGLPEMTELYALTTYEQHIFRLVVEYQTLEELNGIQRIIKELLEAFPADGGADFYRK